MRLVDTSAWIEWFLGSPASRQLEPLMPVPEEWIVPTIVQLELAKWLMREANEDELDKVLAFSQMCVVAPLNSEIAVRAAECCAQHQLATADAIIYATALVRGADVLTCDAHFRDLSGVTYVPKGGA
jgi:predicted nucleic acid-binding protein